MTWYDDKRSFWNLERPNPVESLGPMSFLMSTDPADRFIHELFFEDNFNLTRSYEET